ncbi:hypothetical protein KSS87_004645 [Heliosperma pusillum]|nr:hypothetical protein KSS87_004645 [Heliosperma pusillum]
METTLLNTDENGDDVAGILPLASISQQPYVSELLSFTLDRLHKEPELLRVDAERIRRQMQEVAVANYRSFISAADALVSIREEVSAIDEHLESLISEVPKLTSGCTEFIESGDQILEKKKMNQTLLANHSTLLDLLEIPQLMDTCVRNGNYDEALDLEAFVSKLCSMHPKIPVIQALAEEVKQTTQSLLSQLLQKLRSNIQLPECLRIIGYLRRIGVFSEYEMRLQFLRCREAWLTGILDDLDQRNPYEYLRGMVGFHRPHLFDVVNQYRAIFVDDTSGSEENYDGGLLFSWAMHQITSHLKTLKHMLPKISEGASLASILDQCMFGAMGLGWVGLDFRGLLPSLFEEAVLSLFAKNITAAVENFQLVLDSHRWVPLPAVGFSGGSFNEESQEDVTPPSYLMEHPPLAVFINGVLPNLFYFTKFEVYILTADLPVHIKFIGSIRLDELMSPTQVYVLQRATSTLALKRPIYNSKKGMPSHQNCRCLVKLINNNNITLGLKGSRKQQGVSLAMNELRPCAPISLKHILAQELVKGLRAVQNSLLRYNESRMLRENESTLFFSLCRAFLEVAFPYCSTCFGGCCPGGAGVIMSAKGSFDGLTRLLSVSSSREIPRRTQSVSLPIISDNGSSSMAENGVIPDNDQKEETVTNAVEDRETNDDSDSKSEVKDGDLEGP